MTQPKEEWEKLKRGRPSEYSPEHCAIVLKMEGNVTNSDIAQRLGVAVSCVHSWRNKHPEFEDAVKVAKDRVDDRVENALRKSAEEGSNTAQIFWLKNRRRQDWQDRRTWEADPDNPPVFVIKSILDKDKDSKE